ncbi:MAG: protease modulator HflC [Phycisphaerae bacterium]|nr:MAG: protease modulator HflC [Planctomycetota bacterium]KAB2946543.1 MAG: protease modulator HflC [Phycisphaerae bacterium]MBE7455418.1 protease modulator HflC [Planctomycetia bacterium]MCK6464983.1 protease modulator HflC [Phycisphaerae bacterium]MCL4717596.1 protease modulator HflC [Phycisphaerae bacterium]
MKKLTALLVVLVAGAAGLSCAFTVHETELAVVTRFGKPTLQVSQAGLYFKAPTPIDRVTRIDRRLLVLDVPKFDEPPREFLTGDKKNIEVSAYACWKVKDPLLFLRTLGSREGAEAVLRDAVLSSCGKVLSEFRLDELFSTDPARMKLASITRTIHETCEKQLEDAYGLDIVDIRLKRINLPEANRSSVFERMRYERKKYSSAYLNEGESEAVRIRSAAATEEKQILGQAYEEVKRIEGDAEAKVQSIYAAAFGQDPEFYAFLRYLESYEKSLTQNVTLFVPGDHPYLRGLSPAIGAPPPASPAPQVTPPEGEGAE